MWIADSSVTAHMWGQGVYGNYFNFQFTFAVNLKLFENKFKTIWKGKKMNTEQISFASW